MRKRKPSHSVCALLAVMVSLALPAAHAQADHTVCETVNRSTDRATTTCRRGAHGEVDEDALWISLGVLGGLGLGALLLVNVGNDDKATNDAEGSRRAFWGLNHPLRPQFYAISDGTQTALGLKFRF